MLNAVHFIKRHFISFISTLGVTVFSTVLFTPGFWPWLGIGVMGATYFVTTKTVKTIQLHNLYKNTGLTRAEYKHISGQVKKANEHITTLNQNYVRVRSVTQFKQIIEINRLAKNIIKIVKKDPKKFYNVEPFFYAHLESATQLTKQYTMLTQQPVKDKEIHLALADTRTTLDDLHETIKSDLKDALTDDIEHLKMEIEFAKLSNDQHKQQLEWRGEDQ